MPGPLTRALTAPGPPAEGSPWDGTVTALVVLGVVLLGVAVVLQVRALRGRPERVVQLQWPDDDPPDGPPPS